jgi:hypothetical protein
MTIQTTDKLSAAAQLNVDADQTRLLNTDGWSGTKPSPKITHLKEQKVSIAINGEIYPTRIDEQIRYHINGSYLKEQLKRKHGWSESTWGTIDITAFGRHFKSLAGIKQVQHMKFVHNLQSIGVNKAKIQRDQEEAMNNCPCCTDHIETQQHLLQCRRNPARVKAINSITSATKKSEGKNKFFLVIGDFITQWLSNPEQPPSLTHRINPFLRHETYPPEYVTLINTALTEQADIGWLNMFRGFLTDKWHQLASSYFSLEDGSTEIINRGDGANRVYRVIKLLYNLTTDLWLGRNEVLHGIAKDHEIKRVSALDSEITKFHSEPDLVLIDDQFYCETSLRRLLRSSTANKRRWLLRVKASRARKATLLHQQPRITKFFTAAAQCHRPPVTTQDQPQKEANKSTQQSLPEVHSKCVSTHPVSARNTTTQQLLTQFLRERAPNLATVITIPSPAPPTPEIG